MALSILNNIASIAAQNQLGVTNKSLNTALFQLSSGSRINTGADDAAGLAIADGLHANITALTQSARNANDGVGELQVADGSLAQVTTLLNRAVTLATESATGTVSNSQRVALDAEYTAIKAEIDRVGSKTNYNGGQVFTSSTLNVFLSDAGATSNSTIGVTTGLLSSAGVGLASETGQASATLTQAAGAAAVQATDTLTGGTIANGSSVTAGGTTYNFVTALTGAANEVVVGGSLATSLTNLVAAVNGGAGAGTTYGTGTVANANVQAGASSGTAIVFTATAVGAAGNGQALSASAGSVATFNNGGVTSGGTNAGAGASAANGDTISVGGTTYTFKTALTAGNATANEVLLGTTEALSLANLANAVNGGPGSGTTYGSTTVTNANVTATAAASTVTFTATAAQLGTAGNALASTVTGTANTFGATTFTGGTATAANNLLSATSATAALATINTAIQTIASLRGTIGATVNRLQSAASVINNQVQNLTGAEDGVRAADIPSTVATLAKFSILEQTGISALAQANQQQQLVLKLLQ